MSCGKLTPHELQSQPEQLPPHLQDVHELFTIVSFSDTVAALDIVPRSHFAPIIVEVLKPTVLCKCENDVCAEFEMPEDCR